MGVSLKIPDMLAKYLGEFFPYICRKLMLFIPNKIDEANIQVQYLEGDKQKQQRNPHKQVEPKDNKERRRIRRSGMRRRLWKQRKRKHLLSNNVKDVI